MEIKFNNESIVKSIDSDDYTRRSKRFYNQIEYYKKNPSKYIEFFTCEKLPFYQRLYIDKVLPLLDKLKKNKYK